MSELKAMALVGAGLLFLSAPIDVVLLKMHADGTSFALSLALVAVIGSVAMTLVNKHYESVERRQRREAMLMQH